MTRLQVELAKEHKKVVKVVTAKFGATKYIKVERGTYNDYISTMVFVGRQDGSTLMWYHYGQITTKQLLQYIKHNEPTSAY